MRTRGWALARSEVRRLRDGQCLVRPLAVLAGCAVVASGCGEQAPPPEPVARPVKIIEFGQGGRGLLREYPGEVTSAKNTEVAFEVAGKLIDFPVRESQEVARGDVLARLDPRDYEAARDAAAAKSAAARADYSRMQALYKEQVISKQQLEKAQRNHEVMVAQVKRAEKAVEDTVLRAPFAGTVARRIANDFDNVTAKQSILVLQTGSALEIVVNLPEQDYARIEPGLTIAERNEVLNAAVEVSAIPGRQFPARLKEFATTADPKTRTFAVTFSFEQPKDVNIMPGMTAKVVGRASQLVLRSSVPIEAVAEDEGGKPFVWVVDPEGMRVARTPVTLGELTGSSLEVKSGLEPGSWVVYSGVHHLRDGMAVRRLSD